MNRAFLILFILLIKNSFFAQVYNNTLVFYGEKGKVFTLYVNDIKVNELPESNVKAFNIDEGWQKIKIEFNSEKDNTVLTDSIRIKQLEKNENAEFTYLITDSEKNGKVHHKIIFNTQGDRSGPILPRVPDEPKEIIPLVDSAVYGNLYRARNNKPVFFENYDLTEKKCKVDLTDKDIKLAINLVDKTNDIEDKYKYIDHTIEKNCYSSEQLNLLLNLVDIEMDKLKLAQKAYEHLKDKNNAATISRAFKYPTVKEEYAAFLKTVAIKQQQQELNCVEPVAESQFLEIFKSIKNVNNEYDKTKFAKKELTTHCFNTEQIGKIMDCFMHDRERLDFVQSGFLVVTDKANLEKLADHFQFSETKTEYLKLISK